jgi:hypothetical protein
MDDGRAGANGLERDDEIGFRDDLAAHGRHGGQPRDPPAPLPHRHAQLEAIAGHDLPAELGVVHAAQPRAAIDALGRRKQQQARDLRERLDHQHARHQRRAGKCPWKNSSFTVTFLTADDGGAGLVPDHRINEHDGYR